MVNWFTVRSPQDCGYTSWYKDQRSRRIRVVLTVLNMISFACYSIFFALSMSSAWSDSLESGSPSNGSWCCVGRSWRGMNRASVSS